MLALQILQESRNLAKRSLALVLCAFTFSFSPMAAAKAPATHLLSNKTEKEQAQATKSSEDHFYEWSIDDVRKIAESQNPDLKAAKASYTAASSSVMESLSGYLPHLDIEGGFERTTLPSPSAGSTDQVGTFLPYSQVVAYARQTIFDFGKVLNEIGAAKEASRSAEQNVFAVHDAVDLAVQQAFYNSLSAQKLVEISEQGVIKFEETQRRTQSFVKVGTRPTFDLTQANVELSRAKLTLLNAVDAKTLADVTLVNLLGFPSHVTFKLKENILPPSLKSSILNLNHLIDTAVDHRPELKKAEYAIESARLKEHRALKEYLPTLGAEGWYGQYNPSYPTSIANAYGIGLTLKWNLFDGLKTTGSVERLAANVDFEVAGLERERERIVADVARCFSRLKRAEGALDLAKKTLDYSVENARLARRRYNSNVATFLELLIADTSLLRSQAEEVESKYQYEIAIAELKHAVKAPLTEEASL